MKARAGTGKSAVFVISMLHLVDEAVVSSGPQCMVLVPTKEVAQSVVTMFKVCLRASLVFPFSFLDLGSAAYWRVFANEMRIVNQWTANSVVIG